MSAKQAVKRIRDLIDQKDFATALKQCSAALEDSDSPNQYLLWVFSGICHHKLDDLDGSVADYKKAIDIDGAQIPAWQGLRDVHLDRRDVAKLVPVVEKLAQLAKDDAGRCTQYKKALPLILAEEAKNLSSSAFLFKVDDQASKLRAQRAGGRKSEGKGSEWPSTLDNTIANDLAAATTFSLYPEISRWLAELFQSDASSFDTSIVHIRRLLPLITWAKHTEQEVKWVNDLTGDIPALVATVTQRSATAAEFTEPLPLSPVLEICLSLVDEPAVKDLCSKIIEWQRPSHLHDILQIASQICDSHGTRLALATGAPVPPHSTGHPLDQAFLACCVEGLHSAGTVRNAELDALAQELAKALGHAPYCIPGWLLLSAVQFRAGWHGPAREAAASGLLYLRYLTAQYSALPSTCALVRQRALLQMRVLCCGALGDWGRAMRSLEQLEALDPQVTTEAQALLSLLSFPLLKAEVLMAQNQPSAAIPLLTAVPSSVQSHYLSAKAEFINGEVQAALSCAKKALALCKGYAVANLLAGQCSMLNPRSAPETALKFLLAAAKADPDRAECFAWLGHYYFKEAFPYGTIEIHSENAATVNRIIKCYDRAIGLDPTEAIAGRQLVRIHVARQQPELIFQVCQTMGDKEIASPRLAWAQMYAAEHLLRNGKAKEAHDGFLDALRHMSANSPTPDTSPPSREPYSCEEPFDVPFCRLGLGRSYEAQGQYISSLKTYSRMLQDLSTVPMGSNEDLRMNLRSMARYRIGYVHHVLGEHLDALQALQHLTDECPQFVLGWCTKAEVLLTMARHSLGSDALYQQAQQQLQDAKENSRWAITLAPGKAPLHKLLGDICATQAVSPYVEDALEVVMEAEASYQTALSLGGPPAVLQYALGKLYHDARLLTSVEEEAEQFRQKAETAFRAALTSTDSDPSLLPETLWLALGSSLPSSQPTKQQHCFLEALHHNEKCHAAWTALGFLYVQHGKLQAARAAFQKSQSLCPSLPHAWLGQAFCSSTTVPHGLISESQRKLFLHAYSLGSNRATQYYAALAVFLSPDGALPAIKAHLGKILAHDPCNISALNLLGCYYELHGHYDLAMRSLEEAVRVMEEQGDEAKCMSSPSRFATLTNLLRVWCRSSEPLSSPIEVVYNEWDAAAQSSSDTRCRMLRLAYLIRSQHLSVDDLVRAVQAVEGELGQEQGDGNDKPSEETLFRLHATESCLRKGPTVTLQLHVASTDSTIAQKCAAVTLAIDALAGRATARDTKHPSTVLLLQRFGHSPSTHELLGAMNLLLDNVSAAMEHLHFGLQCTMAVEESYQPLDQDCYRLLQTYGELVAHIAPQLGNGEVECHPDIHPAFPKLEPDNQENAKPAPIQHAAERLFQRSAPDKATAWALACALYSLGAAGKPLTQALTLYRTPIYVDEHWDEPLEDDAEEAADSADATDSPKEDAAPDEELPMSIGGIAPISTVQQTIFACQRLLKDHPDCPKAWRLLGLALASGAQLKGIQAGPSEYSCCSDAATAIQLLQWYSKSGAPNAQADLQVQWAILKCFIIQRNWEEAQNFALRWLEAKPAAEIAARLYLSIATCRWLSNPKDEGWQVPLATALDLVPEANTTADAAILLKRSGEVAWAADILKDECQGLAAHIQTALLAIALGKPSDALDQLQPILASNPTCVAALTLQAHCHLLNGDAEAANSVLQTALRLSHSNAPLLHHLKGQAQQRRGNLLDAFNHFKEELPFSRSYGFEEKASLQGATFAAEYFEEILQQRKDKEMEHRVKPLSEAEEAQFKAELKTDTIALLRRAGKLNASNTDVSPQLAEWTATISRA